MNIICKLLGHKPVGLNVKRMFASCKRCDIGLKVSYDIMYGDTVILGDYGDQTTFCWCECGNELCSDDKSQAYDTGKEIRYICGVCNIQTNWNFDAPVPILLKTLK